MENEKCKILWDMTIQCDHVIEARRPERKIGSLWGIRHLEVVPVVVGALGVVSNRLDAWLEKLGVTIKTELWQKTALLGTTKILRKLLES